MDEVAPCEQWLKELDALYSLALLKQNSEEAHRVLLLQVEFELPETDLGLQSQKAHNAVCLL